jgi:microcystin-dependent protein
MGVYKNSSGTLDLLAGGTLYADAPVGSIQAYGGATAPCGWLLCQGQAISRATYAELFDVIGTSFGAGNGSTTFNVPDLRGRFAEGLASGDTLGARKNAGLPNIKGQITGGALCSLTGASGAISAETVTSAKYNESGTFMRYSLTFNAHNSNSIYSDDVSTVQPPAVCVNYIIKATTISLPSDFEAAVDEKIDDALERTSVVIAGNDVTGLLLEKSGHVVCAEYNGINAATIITGTIPEAYRPSRNVLSTGILISDNKSYVCWVWFCSNGTINGSYAPFNGTPVSFDSTSTSWSVHGCASWIVP